MTYEVENLRLIVEHRLSRSVARRGSPSLVPRVIGDETRQGIPYSIEESPVHATNVLGSANGAVNQDGTSLGNTIYGAYLDREQHFSMRLTLRAIRCKPAARPRSGFATNSVAACTLARSRIRDPLSEGFRHFVPRCLLRLLPAGKNRRVGLAFTGKRRLVTAHPIAVICPTPKSEAASTYFFGCSLTRVTSWVGLTKRSAMSSQNRVVTI